LRQIKTNILYSITFSWNSRRVSDNVEKYVTAWQHHRRQYSTAHSFCILDK